MSRTKKPSSAVSKIIRAAKAEGSMVTISDSGVTVWRSAYDVKLRKELTERCTTGDPDEVQPLFMDFYDDCIIGILRRFGQPAIILYNQEKVIQRMVDDWEPITAEDAALSPEERRERAYDDAVEFYAYNQLGAWCGAGTPGFVETLQ